MGLRFDYLLPLTVLYLNRVVIPLEEEVVRRIFGPLYALYRQEVRRWI